MTIDRSSTSRSSTIMPTTHIENVTSLPFTSTTLPPIGTGSINNAEIFTLIVMLVVTALSLIGNLLVIGAVYIRESLRSPNNMLLVNLAFADLGQGIIAIPLRMTEIFNRGRMYDVLEGRSYCRCGRRYYRYTGANIYLCESIYNIRGKLLGLGKDRG